MSKRTLCELAPNASGYVYAVGGHDGKVRRRIIDMGITPGTEVTLLKKAPMGDPMEISVRGYSLSIRREDAMKITLMDEAEESVLLQGAKAAKARAESAGRAALIKKGRQRDADRAGHERAALLTEFMIYNVNCCDIRCGGAVCFKEAFPGTHERPMKLALLGNPNSGKTTLFNAMTGAREYVGNWPGVTVEKKEGKLRTRFAKRGNAKKDDGICTHGHDITLVDLPGIYSLSPYSMEEVIARNFLIDEKPDAIINIVDGTNLERNLYLSIQLMELEVPMIIALNMMDEVEKNGDFIDVKRLSLELGVPIIPISARTRMGLDELKESIQKLIHAAHTQLHEGFDIEPGDVYDDFTHVQHHRIGVIVQPYLGQVGLPLHWTTIKLLEGDKMVEERLSLPRDAQEGVDAVIAEYAAANPLMDNETMVADSRYRYITEICRKALTRKRKQGEFSISNRIDAVLTHKLFAIPLFIGIMGVIFLITFSTLGAHLSDQTAYFTEGVLMPAIKEALIAIHAGDLFISLVCDGILTGMGGVLTFLPQIVLLFFFLSLLEDSGYMSRIAFIMDKPMRRFGLSGKSFIPLLMGFGCTVPAAMGARTMESAKDKRMTIMLLPFMSCSAKLPVYALIASAFFAKGRGLVIISLYALGVGVGMVSGYFLKGTLFRGGDAPFVMELPPYRLPGVWDTLIHVWERTKHFLTKAGTIILAMSVLLWALMTFTFSFTVAASPEESILGRLSSFAPLFTPLGFGTWRAAVALVTGFVAKEAIVSALAMFYGFSIASGSGVIAGALSNTFTPVSAYSFLVFVLLYPPCVAAVTTMGRELGSRKLMAISVLYQVLIAYLVSMLVYTFGTLIFIA